MVLSVSNFTGGFDVYANFQGPKRFIGPEEGLLSCGYEGIGRLWPVDKVAGRALELLAGSRR